MTANMISLADLGTRPVGELAAEVSVEELALLADEIAALEETAKTAKRHLNMVVRHKFAQELDGHTLGTKRIAAPGFGFVVVDIPKRVEWDQAKLVDAEAAILRWGSNPAEYFKVERKVSETAYGNWPSEIRAVFEPARTVKTGSQTVKFDRRAA